MRRMKLFGIPVLAFVVLAGPLGARPAAAQAKTAKGTVTAVSESSLTVKVGAQDMTFQVDKSTVVEVKGAGQKTRAAGQAGAVGPTLPELVKTGRAVVVTYSVAANGANHATRVRPVASAGPAESSAPAAPPSKTASGRVKSVSATALTVTSEGTDRTFSIDTNTKVVAKGAGTATNAAGGRIPVTDLVHAGDTVSVSYTEAGSSMTAKEIRITVKAP
jgi:Domain of unknown function (DUF5666)